MLNKIRKLFAHPRRDKGRLIICETATSTYHYHLRRVGRYGPKFGGGAGKALCGAQVGWDTHLPLDSYGEVTHIGEHWCTECAIEAGLE